MSKFASALLAAGFSILLLTTVEASAQETPAQEVTGGAQQGDAGGNKPEAQPAPEAPSAAPSSASPEPAAAPIQNTSDNPAAQPAAETPKGEAGSDKTEAQPAAEPSGAPAPAGPEQAAQPPAAVPASSATATEPSTPETPAAAPAQASPEPVAPAPAAATEAPASETPAAAPSQASPEPAAPPATTTTEAPAPVHHHAVSLVKTPKYGPDFKHFDYVNPDAPKGGTVRLVDLGPFDNLNLITFKGQLPQGISLIYDPLFESSLEEPSTEYGLIAEWVSYPDDYSSATFKLRDNARWHDGTPITPEDVIFSMEVQKQGNPLLAAYYKNVVRSEKTGDREVTFYFDKKNNRELPVIVGQLTVLPKHYWTGKGPDGQARDPFKTTLEPPLGSGAYKIKEVVPGRSITYERVPDYWAKDLPVMKGYYNFDQIRYEVFLEQASAFEAFKKGEIDYYPESSAKNWATAYNFPALARGDVIKRDDIHLNTPKPMQGLVFNTRRQKFADPRVRLAFNYMFNFEWINKNLFYGQYKRAGSYFENTELAASGLPQGLELEILNEVKDQVPPQVFTEEYHNPVNETPEQVRENTRKALALLREAGWTLRPGPVPGEECAFWCRVRSLIGFPPQATYLRNAAGEIMTVEFLFDQPVWERIALNYIESLKNIGVLSTMRTIDSSQYKERTDVFDFDAIVAVFPQSDSPGNEQRDFWGSEAADRHGSRNDIGIKNPAVDKLIDRIIFAKNREELVAACRALDRVLLWNHYLIPQWYSPNERVAYWNKFAAPQTLPTQAVGFLQVWWEDKEKAAKLAASK